jgi:hypothetical protein
VSDSDAIKKREAAAKKICENLKYYKVCEGCESVILYDSIFCPVCKAYRFDTSPSKIIKTVNELVKRERTTILPSDLI